MVLVLVPFLGPLVLVLPSWYSASDLLKARRRAFIWFCSDSGQYLFIIFPLGSLHLLLLAYVSR